MNQFNDKINLLNFPVISGDKAFVYFKYGLLVLIVPIAIVIVVLIENADSRSF